MKPTSLIIAYLTVICHAAAQDALSVKQFLAGAKSEESVAYQRKKLAFLTNISHELPWVERLEVRTETNEFDFRQQQYALRVSPNSRRAIKSQRQFQGANRYLADTEVKASLGEALEERYLILVRYIHLQRELALLMEQKTLYADMVSVLRGSIALPGFDILDLISAEDEQEAMAREIFDVETNIATTEKEIKRKTGSEKSLALTPDKLLGMKELKAFLAEKDTVDIASHQSLEMLSAKIYSSSMAYEWEASNTKVTLSYLQARYGYDPNDNFSKGFTLGVGFDFPLRGAARLDLNELQIKTYELESEYRDQKSQLEAVKYNLTERLNNLLQQHELVASQITDSQAEHALKVYGKIAEKSPRALLKLRENTLKKQLILQKLEMESMLVFVDYLSISGLLVQSPMRNYLAKDFELL